MKKTFKAPDGKSITLLFALGAIQQVFCKKLNRTFNDIEIQEGKSPFDQMSIFSDLFLSFWYYGLMSEEKYDEAKELLSDLDIAQFKAYTMLEAYNLQAFSNDIVEFMQTFTTPPPEKKS